MTNTKNNTRYFLNGKEIPHRLMGAEHPSCPNCKRYNWAYAGPRNDSEHDFALRCQDCGAELIAVHRTEEADLVEDLRKAIFDVELMIQTTQVTDGPRNSKERTEHAERHALVGRLTKIRRALYRSKDLIENLEA